MIQLNIYITLKMETIMKPMKTVTNNDNFPPLYNFEIPYSKLPATVKRINSKFLDNYFEYTDLDNSTIEFLKTWYWLMYDISKGRAFNYAKFDMFSWLKIDVVNNIKFNALSENPDEHFCGTSACAWGYARLAGIIPNRKLNFFKNSSKVPFVVVEKGYEDTIHVFENNEVHLGSGGGEDLHLLPNEMFGFITLPGNYLNESKLITWLETRYPEKFKDFIDKIRAYDPAFYAERDNEYVIRHGVDFSKGYFPITPGDVATRIKIILKRYRFKIEKPDPKRPWLNKRRAVEFKNSTNKKN